jgi:hypothetical protein
LCRPEILHLLDAARSALQQGNCSAGAGRVRFSVTARPACALVHFPQALSVSLELRPTQLTDAHRLARQQATDSLLVCEPQADPVLVWAQQLMYTAYWRPTFLSAGEYTHFFLSTLSESYLDRAGALCLLTAAPVAS